LINRIEICNTATFKDEVQKLDNLKQFNYFFGANGSGKTTISRVISNPSGFSKCSVNWFPNIEKSCYVYNRDFIDTNFKSDENLKGVFTLGKQEVGTQKRIDEYKEKLNQI